MIFYANTEANLIAGKPDNVQDDDGWGLVIYDPAIGNVRLDVKDGYLQVLTDGGPLTIEPQSSNYVRIRVNVVNVPRPSGATATG